MSDYLDAKPIIICAGCEKERYTVTYNQNFREQGASAYLQLLTPVPSGTARIERHQPHPPAILLHFDGSIKSQCVAERLSQRALTVGK
ncbi:hypothetical protein KCP69_08005 [Salmonella enterica subsp. enterica]|nr:hypothetical protein KCP69_08005 [Salmonella enterica subsp. enterica]